MCDCVFVWLDKDKKWSHSALETTFSLAAYKSSCSVMDYFSCPWCEWAECLQRQLHNKGSLFLWADVRPSQQDILCEDRQSRPFFSVSLSVPPQAGSSLQTKLKLAHGQNDELLIFSPVDRKKFVCFQVCVCLLARLSHFLTCLLEQHMLQHFLVCL